MLPLTVIKSGGNAELSGAAICLPRKMVSGTFCRTPPNFLSVDAA